MFSWLLSNLSSTEQARGTLATTSPTASVLKKDQTPSPQLRHEHNTEPFPAEIMKRQDAKPAPVFC